MLKKHCKSNEFPTKASILEVSPNVITLKMAIIIPENKWETQKNKYSSLSETLHFYLACLYFCFKNLTDQNIFAILYGLTSIYFAGVMVLFILLFLTTFLQFFQVRLMLVLAPIMCILGGITISSTTFTVFGWPRARAIFGSVLIYI
jgi:dolichyl-diphosphooligosaccharide--protein glycosyltransferase